MGVTTWMTLVLLVGYVRAQDDDTGVLNFNRAGRSDDLLNRLTNRNERNTASLNSGFGYLSSIFQRRNNIQPRRGLFDLMFSPFSSPNVFRGDSSEEDDFGMGRLFSSRRSGGRRRSRFSNFVFGDDSDESSEDTDDDFNFWSSGQSQRSQGVDDGFNRFSQNMLGLSGSQSQRITSPERSATFDNLNLNNIDAAYVDDDYNFFAWFRPTPAPSAQASTQSSTTQNTQSSLTINDSVVDQGLDMGTDNSTFQNDSLIGWLAQLLVGDSQNITLPENTANASEVIAVDPVVTTTPSDILTTAPSDIFTDFSTTSILQTDPVPTSSPSNVPSDPLTSTTLDPLRILLDFVASLNNFTVPSETAASLSPLGFQTDSVASSLTSTPSVPVAISSGFFDFNENSTIFSEAFGSTDNSTLSSEFFDFIDNVTTSTVPPTVPIVSRTFPLAANITKSTDDSSDDGNVFPLLSNNISVDDANNATYMFQTQTVDESFDLSNSFYNLTDRVLK